MKIFIGHTTLHGKPAVLYIEEGDPQVSSCRVSTDLAAKYEHSNDDFVTALRSLAELSGRRKKNLCDL
jgi:hypothetical protein